MQFLNPGKHSIIPCKLSLNGGELIHNKRMPFKTCRQSLKFTILSICSFLLLTSCGSKEVSNHEKMIMSVAEAYKNFQSKDNMYSSDATLAFYESTLKASLSPQERMQTEFMKALALLNKGNERECIDMLYNLYRQINNPYQPANAFLMKTVALANLRLGEKQNCLNNHSTESCIIPLRGNGIHKQQDGSRNAIEIYQKLLEMNPKDYESRWLLNIAFMTIGGYPQDVPKKWLVPGIDKDCSGGLDIKPFIDVAPHLGLNIRNNAGGSIVEDFNNDGYLDIVTSDWELNKSMHYFRNDTKGGFIDHSKESGLSRINGGLNLLMADYDNDGDPDIFVLRGAWCEKYGRQPNSLLRNNGDETFTDVTIESGLFSRHPTQTGSWNDFNNDGWLDLYIGNESTGGTGPEPCELYINNKNGSFTEVAAKAGVQVVDFIKGVAGGDYNNDGLIDLFLSSAYEKRRLFKNLGIRDNVPVFKEVTEEAGLDDVRIRSFPTWFWDYNNDGWLDIFVCGYKFGESIAHSACTEALNIPNEASKMYLYRNNQDGSFTNVSKEAGLNMPVFTMGSNFGDIDNDGFLDMYLGTGNPDFGSLVPNRLFKNLGDGRFADVTIPARVGNLQKGHGVALSDIDNDGDQDIFIEVGGAYSGDTYNNSLYMNPGQNKNHWINIRLIGKETNRSSIGTRLKVSFRENGQLRTVYRHVNTGGSFGCTSLRREIGIGQATMIDEIEITWQRSQKTQVFTNIKADQFITITEGDSDYKTIQLKELNFAGDSSKIALCKPALL